MTDVFRKEYVPLTDVKKKLISNIKDDAQKLYDSIEASLGADTRMLALAKTNLEQSIMWAVKAITG
jgi:hypothetical protein